MSAYIVSGNGTITLVFEGGKRHIIPREHVNYHKIKKGLSTMNEPQLMELLDIETHINKSLNTVGISATITESGVRLNGKIISNSVSQKIMDLYNNGFDVKPMLKFLENVYQNPSKRSVDLLFDFLEHEGMPITDDGHFLAYKAVQSDMWSKTGGKLTMLQGKVSTDGRLYNGVGEVLECLRNEVSDDPNAACKEGLHAGAWGYAGIGGSFASNDDVCVVVKIHPKDVVCVPYDSSNQKMRVCKYEVVGVCNGKMTESPVYNSNVEPLSPEYYYGQTDHTEDGQDTPVDLGKRPNGLNYYNGRDKSGKFKKRGT